VVHVGKLSLRFQKVAGFDALLIKLPSGHKLVYPKARVVKNTSRGWGTVIEFWGVLPNSGGKWGWCSTYGGKLLENATQATAGDVMRYGMECAAAARYEAFMLVHDEILTLMKTGQTYQELCALLCTLAPWMQGLPLAAEGNQLPFYKK
jgi:DNA polymerase